MHLEKALSYTVLVIAVTTLSGAGWTRWSLRTSGALTSLLFSGPGPDAAGNGQRLFRGHAHLSPGGRGPGRNGRRGIRTNRTCTESNLAENLNCGNSPWRNWPPATGRTASPSISPFGARSTTSAAAPCGRAASTWVSTTGPEHDLTGEFPDAPHGEEVFERYPQVGVLKEEAAAPAAAAQTSAAREFWQRQVKRVPLLRRHPHPMVVHFPIVFMIAAPVFTPALSHLRGQVLRSHGLSLPGGRRALHPGGHGHRLVHLVAEL